MNTFKTTILMALLTGLLIAVGGSFAGRQGAMIMLVISLGMNFFSYWYSDKMVLAAYRAQEISRAQAPELYGLVEKLAQKAELPMPKVCVIQSRTPNAFATGRDPEHAAVAVTTGIMEVLDYNELGGVLAHELSHIKHRDTLISTVAASIAGVITTIAHIAQWAAIFGGGRSNSRDDNGGALGLLFTIIVAPFAAMMIQLAISRSREYDADKSGGEICGDPLALASALEKLDYASSRMRPVPGASTSNAHMCIVNPLANAHATFSGLFSTHPSTEERVARLKEQAREMRR
ncbi:MAG: zinc metalloprotease HtpX [Schwartzia sp.]|nr:zinc metalloprotease HtpX [Schwartzia sp. (in: firmicutes)]